MKDNLIKLDSTNKGDVTMKQNNVNYEQQQLHSLLPLGEGGRRPDEGLKETGRPACTNTLETAKEVRSTVKNTLAPCGRGQNLLANECELRNSGEGSDKNNVTEATPHQVRTKLANRSLSPTILSRKGRGMRAAFTLAEVLITLAVIGIVAALTLPGLIQNHNEKAWSTAKDLWEKKLTETVRRMNTDGVMTGHDSTEDFMDTFKQYMKVIKTCDNTDINKCYSPKVVTTGSNEEPMEVETDGLKTASDMGLKSWQTNTNTMSFVVADGTTVIMAYQPECPYADPIEDTGSQVSCMGYMVDVNGKKGPNRVGKDIQLSSGVAFSTCDNPIGDMCWSTDFKANRAINTCPSGSSDVYCSNNYWAGAKKACDQKNMELPTMAQLAQLASNLYVASDGSEITIGAMENKNSGTIKVKDQYKDNLPITFDKFYWSSEEDDMNTAYARRFGTSLSRWDCKGKQYSYGHAVCTSN